MSGRGFKYKTIIDRVITDKNGNILFGENPGNVQDKLSHENQRQIIKELETQIDNQQTMINRLRDQIDKQDEQISKQNEQIDNQLTSISNQETMLTRLQTAIGKLDEQITNQSTMVSNQSAMIGNQETQMTNQQMIVSRLEETFDVVINGNTMELYGSSSDTKPTDVKIGTTFFETDTGNAFIFTGSQWVSI